MTHDLEDLKYVIVLSHGIETPIVFPQKLDHFNGFNPLLIVVSAGYCKFLRHDGGRNTVMTYGSSETLGRRSRSEDCGILQRHFFPE